MSRRWVAGLVLVGLAGLAAGIPITLRHIPFFRVRQVELIGVRYLAPERVLEVLGLSPEQNLFDALDPVQRRVAALAGVVSADVSRRIPGTLRVVIVERTPIAFASGPAGIVVIDCEARPLPYDPAATTLDLPLVERADTVLAGTLCAVRAADSALFQDIDGARHGRGGATALDIGPRRVLLGGVPTSDDITAVGAVRRHLAASGRAYEELDARFAGWVVVRRSRT